MSRTARPRKKDVHLVWTGRSIFLISPYNPNIARKCAFATLRVRLRTMTTFGPCLAPSRSLGNEERDTERISSSESRLLPSLCGDSERPRDMPAVGKSKASLLCPVICLKTQMAEAIQQLVLTTLDRDEEIKDTRQLVLPGESTPAASQDAQLLIIAALNSLNSRNVCGSSHILNLFFAELLHRWSTTRLRRSSLMS